MPAVAERRTLYRDLVLGAAEREFARAGYADAKMAAIARAADLSLATVYKVFPSKAAIWNELHAVRMEALLDGVDAAVAEVASPLERMLSGISAVAGFLTEHDAYLELSLGVGSGWLSPQGSVEVQRSVWVSGLEMIDAGVRACRAAGELNDLRPRVAAGLVVSALQVWLGDWVTSGRDRTADDLVADLVAHLRVLLTTTPAAQP